MKFCVPPVLWALAIGGAASSVLALHEAPRCIDRDLSMMQDGTSHDNPR